VNAPGSSLPEVLSGRICAYCFERASVLVVLGCVQECVYDYVFCGVHAPMFCTQFNTGTLEMLPCEHTPADLIYTIPWSDKRVVFNSDGVAV
jgi:hypothetical protein